MNSYFFRVEHDLLRSEAFKTLGGSAIKVYLVIGLYSDFGTDWAYPSIRTIARQSGLSRQTVLAAIEKLTAMGLLATNKSKGRSTAYRIIREAPTRPPRLKSTKQQAGDLTGTDLKLLEDTPESGPTPLEVPPRTGPKSNPVLAQAVGPRGPKDGPKQEPTSREDTPSIPIPGTPFRLTAEGRLHVAVDLQELLTNQGIPGQLAQRLLAQKDPEAVAKVLLNALYLQSEGKLQNGPGYIRAGIEDGYDLLPQVASRLEIRRREMEAQLRKIGDQQKHAREAREQAAEQAAISYVLERLGAEELNRLVEQAIGLLPEPIVRRNPTLSNPFVRAKVYELACGEPVD
jgi:Helix-turn-helix domain